jgi:hypothetical protein
MELRYEKAMEEYDLSYADLSEDAKTGVDGIKDVLKGIAMLEKRGKKVTQKTINKLKAMDKWVYYEILDQVQGTDENEDEMPENPEEVVDEIKEQAQGSEQPKQLTEGEKMGYEIDAELKKMFDSGKKEWTIEEVKSAAKKTYNILFDTYEEDAENGIKTSSYSLLEKEKQKFVISKN